MEGLSEEVQVTGEGSEKAAEALSAWLDSRLPTESSTLGALFGALAAAQGELTSASKDKANEFYGSKYADLDSVVETIRGPLSRHKLAVIQRMVRTREGTLLETRLGHESGEWIASHVPIKPDKPGIHAIGSAITYMRRYALMAIVGIAPADDDGNQAAGKA